MNKLLPVLFALLAVGCEVLEEDISGKEVRITAPADRTTLAPGVARHGLVRRKPARRP